MYETDASLAAFWRIEVDAHVEIIVSGFVLLYPTTYRLAPRALQ
jgi:hypothetical protein